MLGNFRGTISIIRAPRKKLRTVRFFCVLGLKDKKMIQLDEIKCVSLYAKVYFLLAPSRRHFNNFCVKKTIILIEKLLVHRKIKNLHKIVSHFFNI